MRSFRLKWEWVVVLVCFSQITGSAQDKAKQIDDLLSQYHEYRMFNGSALVSEKGNVILKKGYGLANMEWKIPNQPDIKFRIGSITKQFTSMIIMQLVEEGKIQLDGKLSEFLPEYRKDTGDGVTIHHLLTHTSGIPSYTDIPGFFEDVSRDPYSISDFIQKYCSGDLEFTPGERYRYNNSGYFLLGAIIEEITGKSYEDALQSRILSPLEMINTGYDQHAPILTKRASGYDKTLEGYRNTAYLDMSLPYAAGALYSTVEDLYLWDRALYSPKLIHKKSMAMLFDSHVPTPGGNYGYGWSIRDIMLNEEKQIRSVSHGGGINGFNTIIVRLVDDEHLIVLFNNTGGTNLGGMSRQIINILYGLPFEEPRRSLSESLYRTIQAEGIDAAIRSYHELKKTSEKKFDFRERSLNSLGYELLEKEMVDEAIAVFRLNVEVFPESFNVYDSLGDAYLAQGDEESAVRHFAKVLEINPKSMDTIEKLSRLLKK